MLRFDEPVLAVALRKLPKNACSSFAAACASRLAAAHIVLPAVFAELGSALEQVWLFCAEGRGANWSDVEARLLHLVMDEDDDESFVDSTVDDAASAAVYAVRSVADSDPQNAVWAAQRTYVAADRFASRLLNEAEYSAQAELLLLKSRWVQTELERQTRDLLLVQSKLNGDLAFAIQQLQRRAFTEAVISPDELKQVIG